MAQPEKIIMTITPEPGLTCQTAQEALEPALTTEAMPTPSREQMARKGRSSRRKGAEAEREVAALLSELFQTEVRKASRMYTTGDKAPDVSGLIGLHVEVKRREAVNLTGALRQSQQDANGECPVVMHRGNRQGWMCTVSLADLPRLARVVARLLPD
jgi:hypothetical protein